jgi:hypothetical protein
MYKKIMKLREKARKELLRSLGVDKLVKRAFEEGFTMGRDLDPGVFNGAGDYFFTGNGCWRSVDEAFANSDVGEEV